MVLTVQSQQSKENYHFALFLRKTNDKHFKKCKKKPILEQFLPKFGQKNEFSTKNQIPSIFSIYSPLTSCKKTEKTNKPILRKTLNRGTDKRTNTGEIIGDGETGWFKKCQLSFIRLLQKSLKIR